MHINSYEIFGWKDSFKYQELLWILEHNSLEVVDVSLGSPIQCPYFYDVCYKESNFEIVCSLTRKWEVIVTKEKMPFW